MSGDIKKTISELHIYEKKLLKELETNPDATPEEIAKNTQMDIKSVMSAAGSLASKDIIEVDKDVEEIISLTDNGSEYADGGLPERKILRVLSSKKEMNMGDLAKDADIDKKETNIAIGWLVRKNWAKINKGIVTITEHGQESFKILGTDEKLLKHLQEAKNSIKSNLPPELLDGFKKLNDRKNILNIKKNTSHSFKILDKGEAILKEGFTIQKQATQLTHQQLKDGEWKNLEYRPYDINAEAPKVFPGKKHPLREIIDEIREITEISRKTPTIGNTFDVLIKQPKFNKSEAQRHLNVSIDKDIKVLSKFRQKLQEDLIQKNKEIALADKIINKGDVGEVVSVDGKMLHVKLNSKTQAFDGNWKQIAKPNETVFMFSDHNHVELGDKVVIQDEKLCLKKDKSNLKCDIILCSL